MSDSWNLLLVFWRLSFWRTGQQETDGQVTADILARKSSIWFAYFLIHLFKTVPFDFLFELHPKYWKSIPILFYLYRNEEGIRYLNKSLARSPNPPFENSIPIRAQGDLIWRAIIQFKKLTNYFYKENSVNFWKLKLISDETVKEFCQYYRLVRAFRVVVKRRTYSLNHDTWLIARAMIDHRVKFAHVMKVFQPLLNAISGHLCFSNVVNIRSRPFSCITDKRVPRATIDYRVKLAHANEDMVFQPLLNLYTIFAS